MSEKTSLQKLEIEFQDALYGLCERILNELDYTPSMLSAMIEKHNARQAAKLLINAFKPSEGCTRLWTEGKLNLTVEAFVLDDPQWHKLFTPIELEKAKTRLDELGYYK